MLTAENYLSLVRKRGEHKQPLKRAFRNMLRQGLFVNAYGRIASNKGTMTAGVDGETADGMSLAKIDKLIEELRTGNFRWTPVRRVYIPKKDGKKRPLGIPTTCCSWILTAFASRSPARRHAISTNCGIGGGSLCGRAGSGRR